MNNLELPKANSTRLAVVFLLLLQVGCVTTPTVISADVRRSMTETYDCVWYHHLDGNKEKSSALIDKAIDLGEQGGLDVEQIMSVYSDSQKVQKEIVSIEAQKLADNRGRSVNRLIQIPGESVEPTEKETTQALLTIYKAQCTGKDAP